MQSNPAYRTTLGCITHIHAQHGLAGFFRGFAPTICRAFPANAATLLTYEIVSSLLTATTPTPPPTSHSLRQSS